VPFVKVNEAMAKTISAASPDDNIGQVAKLMKREDTGFIPITENDRLVGVITDRDIVIRCLAEGHSDVLNEPARSVMSATRLFTVAPRDDLEKAAKIMEREAVRRLAVVDEGRLVGVVSHGNLVQALHGEGVAIDATRGVTRGA
jgi:CBS domain-containing protein